MSDISTPDEARAQLVQRLRGMTDEMIRSAWLEEARDVIEAADLIERLSTPWKPDRDAEVAALIAGTCMHGDLEGAHCDADDILCDTLGDLGFTKTVAAWRAVEKWYA